MYFTAVMELSTVRVGLRVDGLGPKFWRREPPWLHSAISADGNLLFYRDTARNGTGDVHDPRIIGRGGWNNFKDVFSGADGTIYAISNDGNLLFYRDYARNGSGDVTGAKGELILQHPMQTSLPRPIHVLLLHCSYWQRRMEQLL